ncbi:pyridoxamine 5'-phosphate oxidase family protein [Nocardioides sp. DS6]|uniref:Pyridoxamine 5'-phosphate oxidase family protein n=1 Tax=Nocardioides eburneus TaxID=3231482 RepID=A0ABV3SYI0_9ACTN
MTGRTLSLLVVVPADWHFSWEVALMRWVDFEAAAPRLAALGRERLLAPGVVLVGTIRRDGSPRISPVEPFVLDGELWLSMLWGSHKAGDLARDHRVLVHSIVTNRDGRAGEFKVRGQCRAEEDRGVQERYAEAVSAALGWQPDLGRVHLFAVDIQSVSYLRYDDATGDQFTVLWPRGREYVRRGTGGTSLGPPEPADLGLLAP